MNRFFTLLLAASCLTADGQVPDYVPTDGLVGWWAFDGNAQDESGNDIDLTEVGSVEYVSDRFGNAISAIGFNGGATESRVQFPNFSLIDGWNQGTLSFWVNVVEHNVTGHYFGFDNMFSVRQRHGVNTQIMLGLLGGTTRVRIHLDGGLPNSGDLVSEQSLVVGQWHLVTMTFNGLQGFQNIYIDGQLSGSLSSSAMLSSMGSPDMFAFGFYGGVGSGSCNSVMDEVGLWNRALDALEVESLFATMAHIEGCIDTSACNFNAEATVDDGSCIPSGCLDVNACNFNSLAQCEGESCDYSCCPGPGCCDVGTEWSWESNTCIVSNPSDSNFDGCVQLNDLLDLLSAYGDCGAEESAWQCGNPLEYQGYDYETVQIGEQCWFAENLRAAKFVNGDSIATGLSNVEWQGCFDPEYCDEIPGLGPAYSVYGAAEFCQSSNQNVDACDVAISEEEFGFLYNWFAVNDERMLCPSGWNVSSDDDWMILESFLGMAQDELASTGYRGTDQGIQLKASSGWNFGFNGTNSSGFEARPGGMRNNVGQHVESGSNARFWTATMQQLNPNTGQVAGAWTRILSDSVGQENDGYVSRSSAGPQYGHSVRCIKDAE